MIKNIDELADCLEDMDLVLVQNLAEAQSQAADLMLQDAYANANWDTGAFALSIHKEPTEILERDIQTFIGSDMQVKSSKGKSYNLGWLLEHGTDPHTILPVNEEYLHFKTEDGDWVKTKVVHHPGTRPYNFYRNAYLNNELEYRDLLVDAVIKSFKEGFK